MSTKAQITANRLNSKKSTGPTTAEGKEAVSQNAFKHGLFVDKAVVRDESQEEYDRHRQALLAQWSPVGETESIVAERFVNLSWRLERAQRMQNQSIEYLGLRQLDEVTGDNIKTLYRKANELTRDDPEVPSDHLLLGRLATRDWSYARVLDRMMLYERRIESSMYKTMHEFEKLQKARNAEQARPPSCRGRLARASRGHLAHDLDQNSETNAGTAEQQSAKEKPSARRHRSNLKKQSQFAAGQMNIKPVAKGYYDNTFGSESEQNKASQSQFQTPRRAHQVAKGEIATALRASQ